MRTQDRPRAWLQRQTARQQGTDVSTGDRAAGDGMPAGRPPRRPPVTARDRCRHRHRRCDRHRRRHRHARPKRPGRRRPAAAVGRHARAAQRDQHSAQQREPLRQGRGGAGVRQQFSAARHRRNFWRGIGCSLDRIAELHADQLDHRARPHRQPARRCARCCKASATRTTLRSGQPNISTRPRRARAPRSRKPQADARGRDRGGDPGRRRSGAIRARQASHRRGAHARQRRQDAGRGDQFRHRPRPSRACGRGRRLVRRARQGGEAASARHCHRRRDRGSCPADGRGAGGAKSSPSARSAPPAQAPKRPPWRSSRASNTPRCSRRASST